MSSLLPRFFAHLMNPHPGSQSCYNAGPDWHDCFCQLNVPHFGQADIHNLPHPRWGLSSHSARCWLLSGWLPSGNHLWWVPRWIIVPLACELVPILIFLFVICKLHPLYPYLCGVNFFAVIVLIAARFDVLRQEPFPFEEILSVNSLFTPGSASYKISSFSLPSPLYRSTAILNLQTAVLVPCVYLSSGSATSRPIKMTLFMILTSLSQI